MTGRSDKRSFALIAVLLIAAIACCLDEGEGPEVSGGVVDIALPMTNAPRMSLARKIQPRVDCTSSELQSLTLVPRSVDDIPALEQRIIAHGGRVTGKSGLKTKFPTLRVSLPGIAIEHVAAAPEVKWVERFVPLRLLNDVAVGARLMNVESVRTTHGLTGRGQVITTSDSGIDTGDMSTMHLDLRTNLIGFAKAYEDTIYYEENGQICSTYILDYDSAGHGTHTAGSIVGTGARSDGQFKGVAYEAKLWAWFCGGADGYVWTPDDFVDTFLARDYLGTTNAYIHSASWGGDINVYNSNSAQVDEFCWIHHDFLPVFAASNDGADYTIAAEGGAKNALCVGATQSSRSSGNPDSLAWFSSRGPMPDGRIKPDICAPGTYIISTRSSKAGSSPGWGAYNDYYNYNGGTSMSTPLTAGTVALIRQWLVEDRGFSDKPPSAALMKAIITGGATRLGTGAPNKNFGWGRVNLEETLFPSNGLSVALEDYIPFRQGSSESFEVTVTNAAPLDVQLCWVDYPADPENVAGGEKTLVIDLDLVVSNQTTGATWTPNDHLNNIEGVHLDAATPATYTIFVKGTDTAENENNGYDDDGAAAVYVRGALGEPEPEPIVTYAYYRKVPYIGPHTYTSDDTHLTFTTNLWPWVTSGSNPYYGATNIQSVASATDITNTLSLTKAYFESSSKKGKYWSVNTNLVLNLGLITTNMTTDTTNYELDTTNYFVYGLYYNPDYYLGDPKLLLFEDGTGKASKPGGDGDGDGFSNAEEMAWGINPANPTNFPFVFTSVSPSNLTFIGSIQGTFEMLHSTNLVSWTSTPITPVRQGVTNTIDLTQPQSTNGFYRVRHTL